MNIQIRQTVGKQSRALASGLNVMVHPRITMGGGGPGDVALAECAGVLPVYAMANVTAARGNKVGTDRRHEGPDGVRPWFAVC